MSALPPFSLIERFTSINFAENQLSLSLIGLSPLASTHLRLLQQTSVRPSKYFYPFFSLVKARSLSFGSNKKNLRTFHTRFCFASTFPFKPCFFYLLADPLCKRYTDASKRSHRLNDSFLFQVLFHSLVKVLFTFPSRYLFTIGFKSIFRPRRWTSCIQTNIVVLLFWTHLSYNAYRTFTFFGRFFHTFLHSRIKGFGLFHVLSPILTESRLISFPWVTKMFQFTQLNKKMSGFPRRKFIRRRLHSQYNISFCTTSFFF